MAHELRTPVAEIRAIAEVTLSRTREQQDYQQALGDIADTIKTLQGLIEKLLTLARLEAGQVKPEVRAVALQQVVDEQWGLVEPRAVARGVSFENGCSEDVVVAADPKLLDLVLANVLMNAATYARRDSGVVDEGKRVGERWALSVLNEGCALEEGEVERAFERFWRADAARGGSGLHCGLGLTLVRRAMEVMRGGAEADVDGEQRFRLTLTFPGVKSDE